MPRPTEGQDPWFATLNGYFDELEADITSAADTADVATNALTTHAANTANPHAVTKAQVGLGNVNNTSDAAKPVSTAQQSALDAKASTSSPTFTGTVSGITKGMVGLGNVDNTTDANKPVSSAQLTALNLKASTASLTAHTGDTTNPHAVTASQVGLGNVTNTSDANKPVSTAQQTALDLKAPLDSPTLTGTVTVPTPTVSGAAATKGYVDTAVATAGATIIDVSKTSDSTRTTTTLTNDPELTFAAGAGDVWDVSVLLSYAADTTDRLKVALALPAGSTVIGQIVGLRSDQTGVGGNNNCSIYSLSSSDVQVGIFGGNGAGSVQDVIITARVKVGGTPGSVVVQTAKNATGTGVAATIYTDSSLYAVKAN